MLAAQAWGAHNPAVCLCSWIGIGKRGNSGDGVHLTVPFTQHVRVPTVMRELPVASCPSTFVHTDQSYEVLQLATGVVAEHNHYTWLVVSSSCRWRNVFMCVTIMVFGWCKHVIDKFMARIKPHQNSKVTYGRPPDASWNAGEKEVIWV